MGRKSCCEKVGLNRGPWTIEEDQKLMNFILLSGIQRWRLVPKLAGLLRCGKSCRLRWMNYLRPDLKRGALTEAEEDQIIQLQSHFGNRWSKIASFFPGHTDNEIKNHWNTRIQKKLKLMSLDPQTHKVNIEPPEQCHITEEVTQPESFIRDARNLKLFSKSCRGPADDADKILLGSGAWWQALDPGSGRNLSSETVRLDAFSVKMDGSSPEENKLQDWLGSAEFVFSWESILNNLDCMFQ